ncbi:MAG: hypothetical protein PHX83_04080 [Acidobacteriia bacterium]|nr:hypothetical protein [Terriglobia bacterium]
MTPANTYLLVIFAVSIGIAGLVFTLRRSRSLLNHWAAQNGFEILQAKVRMLFAGPFTFRHSRGQIVYLVRVRDRAGMERSGWVRCGSFWLGVLSDETEVRWEEVT